MINPEAILQSIGINDYKLDKDEFQACCILCGESKYNLQINFKKNVYHCWVCDGKGRINTLIAKVRGISIQKANRIFKLDEVDIKKELEEIDQIWEESKTRVYDYKRYAVSESRKRWKHRGVNKESIRRFRLGYDSYTRRLVIPIFDRRGTCVALARRATRPEQRPKYLNTKGFKKANHLYGFNSIDLDKDNIVITEGYIDCIRARRFGFNSVAIMGLTLSDKQQELITENFDTVLLMMDNDEPGKEASLIIARQLEADVRVFQLLYKGKDPGDLRKNGDLLGLRQVVLV